MADDFTEAELAAYLDESLDPARAATVELELSSNKELLQRLSYINGRRDAGVHTLGEIWRRHQISVPTPETMRNFLAGELSTPESEYIQFRIDKLKCRFTIAMQQDLLEQQQGQADPVQNRRKKILEKTRRKLKSTE